MTGRGQYRRVLKAAPPDSARVAAACPQHHRCDPNAVRTHSAGLWEQAPTSKLGSGKGGRWDFCIILRTGTLGPPLRDLGIQMVCGSCFVRPCRCYCIPRLHVGIVLRGEAEWAACFHCMAASLKSTGCGVRQGVEHKPPLRSPKPCSRPCTAVDETMRTAWTTPLQLRVDDTLNVSLSLSPTP